MPTDEQLREQFEVFLATWFDVYDRAMLAPKELSSLKAAFEAGHLSRDAEVQALREDRDSYKDAFERVLHSVGVRDDEIEELEERIQKLREALEKVVKTRVAEPTDNLGDALIRLAGALVEARGIARAALAGGKGNQDD